MPSELSNTSSTEAVPTGLRDAEPLKMTSDHGVAAQVLGGQLAHDPAHGVDDVRLAAAVGPDDAGEIAGKADRGGIGERLESGDFDLGQAHLFFRAVVDEWTEELAP